MSGCTHSACCRHREESRKVLVLSCKLWPAARLHHDNIPAGGMNCMLSFEPGASTLTHTDRQADTHTDTHTHTLA